jgi:Family of unknown function (DUF6335)
MILEVLILETTADNDRSFDQQSLADEASPTAPYASAQTAQGEPAEAADAEDLPQALTESYGTGVHESYSHSGRDRALNQASAELTGGDVEANYEQANAVGDEAVGGTAPTPDMDVVDELGKAVGLDLKDEHALRTNDLLGQRDQSRWELEPDSSEDYLDRQTEPNIDP